MNRDDRLTFSGAGIIAFAVILSAAKLVPISDWHHGALAQTLKRHG